jgi:hypothetical protein
MRGNLPANNQALNALLAGQAVVIGMGLLLVCWSPAIDRAVYRVGFFVGLAAFAAMYFGPGGQWDSRSHPLLFRLSRLPFRVLWIYVMFLGMTPYLLLLEGGIAGYRGFTLPWMRYASLVPAILGALGLVAGFLLPRGLGRRERTGSK